MDTVDQSISSKLDFSISNSKNVPFNLTIIDDTSVWLGVPDGTLIDYEQVQFWPLVIEVKVCIFQNSMEVISCSLGKTTLNKFPVTISV